MTTFGSTEMFTFSQWFVPPSFDEDEARLPVGYPLPDHEFKIVDEEGRAVAVGEGTTAVECSEARRRIIVTI